MNKHFWIDGGCIDAAVLVVLGDEAYYKKVMGKCNVPKEDQETHGFVGMHHCLHSDKGSTFHVVWVSGKIWSLDWFGTVAHEVSHLVDSIMERRRIGAGMESTEVRACMTGFYITEIYRVTVNKKKKHLREYFGVKA